MVNKLITESDIKKIFEQGEKEIVLKKGTLLTPLAKDLVLHLGMKLVKGDSTSEEAVVKPGLSISIGSDHTGVKVKKVLIDHLKKKGIDLFDVGTFTEEAVDYPDYAYKVALSVINKEVQYGILIDATGIPSSITANKVPGIRAATCYNEFTAKSSREHNNANVLVLGARALGEETIKSIADVWLSSSFLGDRHQKRLDKITAIEKKYSKE